VSTAVPIVHDFFDGDGRRHDHRRISVGFFGNEWYYFSRGFRHSIHAWSVGYNFFSRGL
jgi:hypothetical protein